MTLGAHANIAPFELSGVELFFPPHLDAKIQAQGGVFTLHPGPFVPFDQENIIKWVIPANSKLQFRINLRNYGISWATLFPGLSGIGLHLDELARNLYTMYEDD